MDFLGEVGDQAGDGVASGVDVAACVDVVDVFGAELAAGLHLDEPAAATVVDDEVVGVGVAEGFGDAEAEVGGAVEKRDFAHLPAAFRVFAHFLHTP